MRTTVKRPRLKITKKYYRSSAVAEMDDRSHLATAVPLSRRAKYNVAWAEATSVPSGVFIHPAVWQ